MRRLRLALAAGVASSTLAAVTASVLADAPQRRGALDTETPSTVEVLTRERLDGSSSLLLSLAMGTGKISEVRAEVPSDKKATAGYLPDGWQHEQKGKQFRAWGPPLDDVNIRFNLNAGADKDYIGKSASVSATVDGRSIDTRRLTIARIDKVNVTPFLNGILTVPPQAAPGRPMLVGIGDAYRRGKWELVGDGTSHPLIPLDVLSGVEVLKDARSAIYSSLGAETVAFLLKQPAPRPYVALFPERGSFTVAKFTDRWGEVLVDAPLMIAPTPALTCPRSISSGAEFTFAGQAACVSGCFPDVTSAYGFMLDGKTTLQPWAVSSTTVMLGIPADTLPGSHTVGADGISNTVTIGVLGLQGSIDQNKLWTGQSTTMKLRILGTDRQLPLVVLNRTPSNIVVEGGAHQTIVTPGGEDNGVSRSVTGVLRGRFEIVYSLNVPGCGGPSPRP